jgi:dissimilatory sulfite reductase (desulfoviridin) alpha/beta subunit
MWNKTGGEAYIKQAAFQFLFTRLHPGTHLTRINCHRKLCSLISKLSKNSVRLTRASWWFSIQIPFSKHKNVAPQQEHLRSSDYTRFGSSVSNCNVRISLVCCCNRCEVSALQERDAASLGNWFPTFRDDEGFGSPRDWHNDPRRRDKYVGRQVPRDTASRSRRTETSRAPLRITCFICSL